MDIDKVNSLCNRNTLINDVCDQLRTIDRNKHKIDAHKGIYIYGPPGSGKTHMVKHILKLLDYDIVYYSASDVRNKNVIDSITKYNMSNVNVLSMFAKKKKNIVIVMDEIDGMNSGDKGGITGLIKLIRPKKTKKQKLEEYTFNPIICIGHHHFDKKIKDLMKVCHVFEMKPPTNDSILSMIDHFTPNIDYRDEFVKYIQNDLFKFGFIFNIYNQMGGTIKYSDIYSLLNQKTYNEDILNQYKLAVKTLPSISSIQILLFHNIIV